MKAASKKQKVKKDFQVIAVNPPKELNITDDFAVAIIDHIEKMVRQRLEGAAE